jgi:hypothetical protein
MVSAWSAIVEPSTAITCLSFTILIARSTTFPVSWITLPGLAREVSEPSGS